MGFLFLFFCIAISLDLAQLLIKGAAILFPFAPPDILVSAKSLFHASLVAALAVAGWGVVAARTIHVEQVTVQLPKVPAEAGSYRIVQISDVHLGVMTNREWLDDVMRLSWPLNPTTIAPMRPASIRRMNRLTCGAGMAALATLAAPAAADNASFAESARATVSEVAGKVRDGAQDLAVYALGLLGVRYRFGGESPESGLDCSGLVRHVFQQVTGVTLPRTASEMSRVGDGIARHELEPGDLVFFNTRRMPFSHVGIYLGGNRFVHAPARGREVEVASFIILVFSLNGLDKTIQRKDFSSCILLRFRSAMQLS